MENADLSLQMKRLTVWLDEHCHAAGLIRVHMPNPPFDDAYVSIDPDMQSRYPSANRNIHVLRGCAEGDTTAHIDAAAELLASHGVTKYFVHLSPGPNMAKTRRILKSMGFVRFGGTGYPVLVRETHEPATYQTDLSVREVATGDMVEVADAVGTTIGFGARGDFLSTAGKPSFTHFAAFDGDLPVATATLCVFGEMGYLMSAATAESHRRQGAQQALIAHRIERAKELGCTYFTSQTLYMLKSSFNNLLRAGFREAYAKEVFVPAGARTEA